MLSAHLFCLYFGVLADVTPPVALATYAASGISKSNPLKTGFMALVTAIAGFIVPSCSCIIRICCSRGMFCTSLWGALPR